MKTFQDLERGSILKVRWPRTTDTALGEIMELPADLQSPVYVRIDGKTWKFAQADVIMPDASFPSLPDYGLWTSETPVYYRPDDGSVVEGRLVRIPNEPVRGSAEFIPAGESIPQIIPAYRLQATDATDNPFLAWFGGYFLTYDNNLLTLGA